MRDVFLIGGGTMLVGLLSSTSIFEDLQMMYFGVFITAGVFIIYGLGDDVSKKDLTSVTSAQMDKITARLDALDLLATQAAKNSNRSFFPDYVEICMRWFKKMDPTIQNQFYNEPHLSELFESASKKPGSFESSKIEQFVYEMNRCLSELTDAQIQELIISSDYQIYKTFTEQYSS